jgi:hypothetical protein
MKIGVHDDRVDRNVREIAGFIVPDERTAVARAYHLKEMAGRGGRIRIESADSRIPYRHVGCCHDWIQGNPKDRPVRQWVVPASDVHPVRLCCHSGTEIEADLDVAIVRSDNSYTLVFGGILNLIDIRAVTQSSLGQASVRAGTGRCCGGVPSRSRNGGGCAKDRLPNSRGARNKVAASSRGTGGRAIVSPRNTTMKEIDG